MMRMEWWLTVMMTPSLLHPARPQGHAAEHDHASRSRTCMKLLWLPVLESDDEGFAEGLQGHLLCLQAVPILSALHYVLACQ